MAFFQIYIEHQDGSADTALEIKGSSASSWLSKKAKSVKITIKGNVTDPTFSFIYSAVRPGE